MWGLGSPNDSHMAWGSKVRASAKAPAAMCQVMGPIPTSQFVGTRLICSSSHPGSPYPAPKKPKTAGLRDSRRELSAGHPRHGRLEDGSLDAKQLGEWVGVRVLHHAPLRVAGYQSSDRPTRRAETVASDSQIRNVRTSMYDSRSCRDARARRTTRRHYAEVLDVRPEPTNQEIDVSSSRDRLIDTTMALLSTQGFEATSPRDIQRESGVGQGSFYHHFKSKADLANAALTALSEQMRNEFDDLRTEGGRLATAYLQADRDALAGCRIGRLSTESSIADERLRGPVSAYFDHLRDELTASLRPSGAPDAELRELADLLIAAVQGGYVIARATGDAEAQRNATRAATRLLEAFLTGSDPDAA